MRKLLLVMVVFFTLTGFRCSKKSTQPTSGVYKGVVIHNVCCQAVIQVLDTSGVGQSSWVDSNKTPHVTYNNVFKVANPCQFGDPKEGDTIRFQFLSHTVAQTCACCLLFLHTPGVSYPIAVVK